MIQPDQHINAYWFKKDNVSNWGDDVNPYIISKMANIPIENVANNDLSGKTLKAIGSIIHKGLKNGDIIWGSGSINNGYIPKGLDLDIRAVRGPLTRNVFIKNGYDCPEVYGDPALLMPFFYNPEIKKEHTIGIIPHVTEIDSPILKQFLTKYPNIKLIDIRLGHEEFIDELKSVKFVLSSSLHGLIAADAYKIPNAKIDIPGPQYKGNAWKYIDYFSSVGRFVNLGFTLSPQTKLQDLTDKSHWNTRFILDLNPLINSFYQ